MLNDKQGAPSGKLRPGTALPGKLRPGTALLQGWPSDRVAEATGATVAPGTRSLAHCPPPPSSNENKVLPTQGAL